MVNVFQNEKITGVPEWAYHELSLKVLSLGVHYSATVQGPHNGQEWDDKIITFPKIVTISFQIYQTLIVYSHVPPM